MIPLTYDGIIVAILWKDAFNIKDALKAWPRDGLLLPSSGDIFDAAKDKKVFFVKEAPFCKGHEKVWVLAPNLKEGADSDLSLIFDTVDIALEGKTVTASNSETLTIHVVKKAALQLADSDMVDLVDFISKVKDIPV